MWDLHPTPPAYGSGFRALPLPRDGDGYPPAPRKKPASATASRFGNWGGFGNWPGLGNCPWIRQLLDLATALDLATGALAGFGNCGSGFANRTGFRNCCLRQLATGYQPPAVWGVCVWVCVSVCVQGPVETQFGHHLILIHERS